MKPLKQTGFTIVETMLFLGISGLLVMGVLVGTGTTINVQRYRDSVASLRSFLQQQYSEVANVSNVNASNVCNGSDNPRGQSDCVILGKYITTSEDSRTINVKTITGEMPTGDPGSNDVEVFEAYDIITSSIGAESYEIEWGSSIEHQNGSQMTFSMLILRSPLSGLIRTFIDNQHIVSDNNVQNLLSASPSALNNDAIMCLNSNGLFTGTKLAVYVEKNAASSSGVLSLGDESECD